MEDANMSPQESMRIINQAINNAKKGKNDAAYYLILWGILMFLFFMVEFWLSLKDQTYSKFIQSLAYLVFPVGGLLSYLHSRKTDRNEDVKTFQDSVYGYVWGGVGLCLGVWAFITQVNGFNAYTPVFVLLFGFASFITGGITKFFPSIAGGVVCIVCAALTAAMPAYQFLLAAIGILAGNVLPGILMKSGK